MSADDHRYWPFRSAGAHGLLIFALVLVAYGPALRAGFIWDDQPGHITRAELQSVDGLRRIWLEPGATQQYYPLLHTAFWVEHRWWGDAPYGYHLINVLLHATAACLFGGLLRRLDVPGAGLAALLFAVHPVMVESVAWVSEQKNTLSAVLFFSTALAYLRFVAERRWSAYVAATLLFVAALATKTVTATLPAALLVIAWWRRGRLSWRGEFAPLAPWLGLSAVAGFVTATVERRLIGADGADFDLGVIERLLLAGRSFWFYASKLLWPSNLAFIYPRWTIDRSVAWQYLFLLAALAALIGLGWHARKSRGPLAATLLFGGLLFPALGFVNVFPFLYSFAADHFQYLASTAMFALAAAAVTRLPATTGRVVLPVVIVACAGLTWRQSGTYRDLLTLYTTTLARNPECWMAHNNLGNALVQAKQGPEALPHYEAALRLRPRYPEAENNFGYALTVLGRAEEALPHLRRALELQPNYAEAQNNLGVAYMALSRPLEALEAFNAAVRLDPAYPLAQVNLGSALAAQGKGAEAIAHFARAAQLDPNYADAELNWGMALTMTNRPGDALPHFERALQLREDFAPAHFYFGLALRQLGRMDESERHLRAAAELGFRPGGG